MNTVYLKIKIKSLAEEARIIRHEEKKWAGPSETRMGLHHHRTHHVRMETRAALLAYAFIRGRRYSQVESTRWSESDLKWLDSPHYAAPMGFPIKRVTELVAKYGKTYYSIAEKKDRVPEKAILNWMRESMQLEKAA